MTEPRAIDRLFESRKQLYETLRAAEDHAAMWVYTLVSKRERDGLGAATQALERIGRRVDDLEDRINGDAYRSGGDVYIVPPWAEWGEDEGKVDEDAAE